MVAIAITGEPGVGKTTLLLKLVEYLRSMNVTVYGFYCPEVREGGKRIGFRIVDIAKNNQGWLALIPEKAIEMGYDIAFLKRIGRYVLINYEAEKVGREALKMQCKNCVLAIDEIGPMELSIEGLRREIIQAIKNCDHLLITLHRNMRDRDILKLLQSKNTEIITLTKFNRDKMFNEMVNKLKNEFFKSIDR
ncbi:nucleoside-triphosphatase [Ignisphaera sp. 4213-co]|uniref:Nucleoside-triphosphatase QPL79_00505 n=1 Tax=Ignisphaera cupida TaxID=3050454 RepID=A0ABD4Z6V6_9CREN|nr:nucleoside-triphosphatase [Ignisphaera sp. 4213-co]MDK6027848.1 nucleoside-triphosphatase [Ignisphaera sp. 4213-co]